MNSTKDKIKGAFNSAAGKAKEAVGYNKEGKEQQLKGEYQKGKGQLKDQVKAGIRKLGDKIEHLAD